MPVGINGTETAIAGDVVSCILMIVAVHCLRAITRVTRQTGCKQLNSGSMCYHARPERVHPSPALSVKAQNATVVWVHQPYAKRESCERSLHTTLQRTTEER